MQKVFKFKRRSRSRMLFSLAACSLSLVCFAAVAYLMVVPTALSDVFSASSVMGQLLRSSASSDGDGSGVVGEASGGPSDGAAADGAAGLAASDELAGTLGSLGGAPLFLSAFENIDDLVGSDSAGTSGPSGAPASPQEPSPNPGNAGDAQPDSQPGLSVQEEAGYHAHLVSCYADLKPYYDEVCAGFSNLYATMNTTDPNVTHVSCAPTDARALLHKCDQARIRVDSYRYAGEVGISQSKWYAEARKLSTCFNDLTNACSAMSDVSGFLVKNAPAVLAPHLDSNGEVRYLAECRERYATIRL